MFKCSIFFVAACNDTVPQETLEFVEEQEECDEQNVLAQITEPDNLIVEEEELDLNFKVYFELFLLDWLVGREFLYFGQIQFFGGFYNIY